MAASLGHLSLILSSFQAASDGAVEGGKVSHNNAGLPAGKNLFLFATTSKPTGQGITRHYKKMFFKNFSVDRVVNAKIWIDSQERSPQIKIAHERNALNGGHIIDGSDRVAAPTTKPANLTLTNFTLATNSTNAIQAGGSGSLPGGSAFGIWVLQTISEGLLADSSVPATFKLSAANP